LPVVEIAPLAIVTPEPRDWDIVLVVDAFVEKSVNGAVDITPPPPLGQLWKLG
jgi:hypothetical protein